MEDGQEEEGKGEMVKGGETERARGPGRREVARKKDRSPLSRSLLRLHWTPD